MASEAKTIEDLERWIDKQTGAAIATIIEAHDGSFGFFKKNMPKWHYRRLRNKDYTNRLNHYWKQTNLTFDYSEENASKENLQKNIFSIREHIIAVKDIWSVTDLTNTDFNQQEDNEICTELYSDEIQKAFALVLKSGIYKELHKRSLLSDEQLYILLNHKYK